MSAYIQGETKITNAEALVEALVEMGFSRQFIEVHAEPQTLKDLHGKSRPQRAEVIVRRAGVGEASNDIGFLKQPSGKFEAIISEYDRGILRPLVKMRTGSDCKDFIAELTARSALIMAEKAAVKRGMVTKRITEGRTIRLVCTRN